MKPLTLIIRTAGTNCDRELAHAFELAGASVQVVHLNELIEQPDLINRARLIGFPGGFSYGDDIAAGRIFANRLRHRLIDPLRDAVGRGVPIIGVCNGFQVLLKLGLLPNPQGDRAGQGQTVTLADNTSGRFLDRWVGLETAPETVCIWTRGLTRFDLPIAHGEGRFVVADASVLSGLRAHNQVAMRYAPATGVSGWAGNPNGSADDIAGISDPSGLVLGLMPHPERFTHPTNHPLWTRHTATPGGHPAGLQMFRNAVEYARRSEPAKAVVSGG